MCAVIGAGKRGRLTKKSLEHAGYKVVCYVDNDKNKQGTVVDGIPVISYVEFVGNKDELVAVIANAGYRDAYYYELKTYGYNPVNVYFNRGDLLVNVFGEEYFDVPVHQKGQTEVFIDAGSLNGHDTKRFIKWCEGEYSKCYIFEPEHDAYLLTKHKLSDVENCEIYEAALGNDDRRAIFNSNVIDPGGARLADDQSSGECNVELCTIDRVLNGEKVTFIKMDIEGAELDALKGAEKSIVKHKPVLAISVYHMENDLVDIPLYIKSIVPEYKMYLRHYTNTVYDTVLYCICE